MTAVLIIDDDPEFRDRAGRVLADGGYEVVATAGTLEQGREALGAVRPDAVLLDVHLPDATASPSRRS